MTTSTPTFPPFTLRRLDQTPYATYGQLFDAEENLICLTLERPWVDLNHDGVSDQNVSCIPPGNYTAHRRKAADTRHGYDVFELDHVPGRSHIQIHIANLPAELEGCIATGSNFGQIAGKSAVLGSAAAFRQLMYRLTGIDRLRLDVVNPLPSPLSPEPTS